MSYMFVTSFEQDQDGTQFHPGPARKMFFLVGFITKKAE